MEPYNDVYREKAMKPVRTEVALSSPKKCRVTSLRDLGKLVSQLRIQDLPVRGRQPRWEGAAMSDAGTFWRKRKNWVHQCFPKCILLF